MTLAEWEPHDIDAAREWLAETAYGDDAKRGIIKHLLWENAIAELDQAKRDAVAAYKMAPFCCCHGYDPLTEEEHDRIVSYKVNGD